MPITQADVDAFRDFAMERINTGDVESLADCVQMWEDRREYEESVAAIREGLEDIAAGRTIPAEQAFAEIRRELGLPERRPVS